MDESKGLKAGGSIINTGTFFDFLFSLSFFSLLVAVDLLLILTRLSPLLRLLHLFTSFVSSIASFVAILGAATPQLAYTASKGAVLAMTRELAVVHAREGIRFNSLCPYVVFLSLPPPFFSSNPPFPLALSRQTDDNDE